MKDLRRIAVRHAHSLLTSSNPPVTVAMTDFLFLLFFSYGYAGLAQVFLIILSPNDAGSVLGQDRIASISLLFSAIGGMASYFFTSMVQTTAWTRSFRNTLITSGAAFISFGFTAWLIGRWFFDANIGLLHLPIFLFAIGIPMSVIGYRVLGLVQPKPPLGHAQA